MGQLVNSDQQKLNLEEIVRIAAENTKSEYSFNQVYISIMKELTMKGSIIIQIGNTIFIMHRTDDPYTAYMRALNADDPRKYLENSAKYADMAYQKYNIDTIVSDFTDPSIVNIFAYVFKNNSKDRGYQQYQSEDGKTFRIIARLGPDLGGAK